MKSLYNVKQLSIKLNLSEKGVYSWILANELKPIIKRNGVGLYSINSFPLPKISFSEDGNYLIINSKLNTMEL